LVDRVRLTARTIRTRLKRKLEAAVIAGPDGVYSRLAAWFSPSSSPSHLPAIGAAVSGVSIGRPQIDDLSKMTIKPIIKFCSVAAAIAAILFATLGQRSWLPRRWWRACWTSNRKNAECSRQIQKRRNIIGGASTDANSDALIHRVIHASPALGDLSRLSLGRVRAKRAGSQGGGRSARPPWSARPCWSARPRRQRCGDQVYHSALRSNGVRRLNASEHESCRSPLLLRSEAHVAFVCKADRASGIERVGIENLLILQATRAAASVGPRTARSERVQRQGGNRRQRGRTEFNLRF
jgi:hypothetical protein